MKQLTLAFLLVLLATGAFATEFDQTERSQALGYLDDEIINHTSAFQLGNNPAGLVFEANKPFIQLGFGWYSMSASEKNTTPKKPFEHWHLGTPGRFAYADKDQVAMIDFGLSGTTMRRSNFPLNEQSDLKVSGLTPPQAEYGFLPGVPLRSRYYRTISDYLKPGLSGAYARRFQEQFEVGARFGYTSESTEPESTSTTKTASLNTPTFDIGALMETTPTSRVGFRFGMGFPSLEVKQGTTSEKTSGTWITVGPTFTLQDKAQHFTLAADYMHCSGQSPIFPGPLHGALATDTTNGAMDCVLPRIGYFYDGFPDNVTFSFGMTLKGEVARFEPNNGLYKLDHYNGEGVIGMAYNDPKRLVFGIGYRVFIHQEKIISDYASQEFSIEGVAHDMHAGLEVWIAQVVAIRMGYRLVISNWDDDDKVTEGGGKGINDGLLSHFATMGLGIEPKGSPVFFNGSVTLGWLGPYNDIYQRNAQGLWSNDNIDELAWSSVRVQASIGVRFGEREGFIDKLTPWKK